MTTSSTALVSYWILGPKDVLSLGTNLDTVIWDPGSTEYRAQAIDIGKPCSVMALAFQGGTLICRLMRRAGLLSQQVCLDRGYEDYIPLRFAASTLHAHNSMGRTLLPLFT